MQKQANNDDAGVVFQACMPQIWKKCGHRHTVELFALGFRVILACRWNERMLELCCAEGQGECLHHCSIHATFWLNQWPFLDKIGSKAQKSNILGHLQAYAAHTLAPRSTQTLNSWAAMIFLVRQPCATSHQLEKQRFGLSSAHSCQQNWSIDSIDPPWITPVVTQIYP